MSQHPPLEAQAPIAGWRVDASGLVARTRWHRSWPIFYFFAVVWNVGLAELELVHRKGTVDVFTIVGAIAAVAFTLLGLRALVARTIVRFTPDELVVENAMAPWQRVRVALREIQTFRPFKNAAEGTVNVAIVLVSGVEKELPIDWQPLAVVSRGSSQRLWVAPAEDAVRVADALVGMLVKASNNPHRGFLPTAPSKP